MKKLYILFLFMVCAGYAQQQPFITTWTVTSNVINGLKIKIPVVGNNNNYSINFGDGIIQSNVTSQIEHTYQQSGTYTVTISGTISGIYFDSSDINNSEKIRSIEQWGTNQWTSMQGAFGGCTNLVINAVDIPDLSLITSMERMFWACLSIGTTGNFNTWDVSNITNMNSLFENSSFNQPLNNWDVSNVTSMQKMFSNCNFNHSINNWDVSSVTDMSYMFVHSSFNQPLDNWDVSNVTRMKHMFAGADYNHPLNNWDVSNVTKMSHMFSSNLVFDQFLDSWDVSNVTDMEEMFSSSNYNKPLNTWDVSSVDNMEGMFKYAGQFNQPLNNWNIKENAILFNMFTYATSFNQDISAWNFTINSSMNNASVGIYSGIDTHNYDKLILKFISYGHQNAYFYGLGLKYCNTGAHNYLIENLGWTMNDSGVGPECVGNTVTGTMLIDENLDGCDASDTPAVNFMVNATNGTYNYGTFVNATGNYDLRVQEDTYTVSPVNVPEYFTVTPESSEVTFTGFGNNQALNFCLVPNQSVQDLNITVLPIGDARPGFESEYKILIENIGTQSVANATVTLAFDNTLQSFVSATPAPATTSANQMTFNVGNLGVFETKEIDFTITTFQPPVVNGGEVAAFTANVTPDAGDNTPDDNTFTLNQTIVNSFDPNDKRVVQGDEIYMEQTGEYLDYIIRFQNTGTASAITVRVEDTLSDNLDWATLKPIAASHTYRVGVTEGNKVNFIFDNINLPHEAADAPGSNGYIAYKVKPKQGIQLGDVIAGNAGIYFDFNLPIITNTVTTTVVEPLGVKQNVKAAVSVYPNPAGDVVHLQAGAGTQVQQATIYNLQGSALMSVSQNQNPQTLNISSLSAGVYLLQVQTSTGRATYRLVKK